MVLRHHPSQGHNCQSLTGLGTSSSSLRKVTIRPTKRLSGRPQPMPEFAGAWLASAPLPPPVSSHSRRHHVALHPRHAQVASHRMLTPPPPFAPISSATKQRRHIGGRSRPRSIQVQLRPWQPLRVLHGGTYHLAHSRACRRANNVNMTPGNRARPKPVVVGSTAAAIPFRALPR